MIVRLELNKKGENLTESQLIDLVASITLKQENRAQTLKTLMNLGNNAFVANYPGYSVKRDNNILVFSYINDPCKLYQELIKDGFNISSSSISPSEEYLKKGEAA